jgi:hypothetical protein
MSAAAHRARAFLAAYKITGSIVLSAEAAGVEKTIHYRWLAKNEAYARDFELADKEFGDVLEACAIGRAKDGVLEAVFYQGAPCGAIRKYSDGLMVHLLKRFKPEKYSTRVSAEVNVTGSLDIVERLKAARKRGNKNESPDPQIEQ